MSLKAIAARCGVSVNTVSRIVNHNDSAQFRAQTVEKVLAAARELKYKPRTESSKESGTGFIGFAASGRDSLGRLRHTLWTFPFINGLHHHVQPLGYHVVMLDLSELRLEVAEDLPNGLCGLVVQGEIEPDMMLWLKRRGIPVVFWDSDVQEAEMISIQRDEYSVGKTLTGMLMKMGHKRIALHAGDEWLMAQLASGQVPWYHREREKGYRDALAKDGLECMVMGGYDVHAIQQRLEQDKITAIITTGSHRNFNTTIVQLAALNGWNIPDNLSLANMTIETGLNVSTTPDIGGFQYDRGEMGQRAAELLLSHINDPDRTVTAVVVPSAFVMGETIDSPSTTGAGKQTSKGTYRIA